jgi:hypothetical protein
MPAVSKSQRRLFGAAEHGADFPLARKLRGSMTHQQLHDFAATKEKGLPTHVRNATHPGRNLGAHLHKMTLRSHVRNHVKANLLKFRSAPARRY